MATLLVDSHVHFHGCFTWKAFLEGASANFAAARRQLRLPSDVAGCLMLTEAAGADAFGGLVNDPGLVLAAGWQLSPRDDNRSVVLRRGAESLVMVAGRQIVTAERLEVLALGCRDDIVDGQPLRDVTWMAHRCGAVPVVPWGFGKWWGRRGRLLRTVVEAPSVPGFCLGDNGGRARAGRRPRLFGVAERQGIVVLAGSDPLPLPAHAGRAGSYGFVLDGWTDTLHPAQAINERLRAMTRSPATFGELSSVAAVIRSQLGIRWQRRRNGQSRVR